MGVTGLWTVIQPCARPTNLATLNRKRLAVDASIWIYQFLKAVRDKEGNALRNSHVVGFFRRICKLLWYGILPVFVFDGGAPSLKRATLQARRLRREGRREDATRTAGKLLAVQMQRLAEEDRDRRRMEREREMSNNQESAPEEPVPDMSKLVYVDEIGMTEKEKVQTRKFHKKDAYHLPELDGGIAAMGKPDDPRIMSVEELEEYARQFNSGEDINLYDFSKIDFDGEFFKSLPPPDRYNIINAARLRSRLRMGLSKEQLDDMFPDRMAFSRFQIERVQERNRLTQRLMYEVGMTGTDLTVGVNARIAGEKNREYILVKNEGVEGGWALGVVSKEKDIGEAHKPIDVDAIQFQYQTKDEVSDDDDEEFEDVPIEGLNRLPKPSQSSLPSRQLATRASPSSNPNVEGSLFVGGPEHIHPEEQDDIDLAIALSLKNQHGVGAEEANDDEIFEDVPVERPEWAQKSVDAPKPIVGHTGSAIARVVNNRANAAVPKRQEPGPAINDSDSDEDMQSMLAKSRKMKRPPIQKPAFENKKNPFDGPLPFPKLDWKSSLFTKSGTLSNPAEDREMPENAGADDNLAGGFEAETQPEDGPRPLPPWLVDETDIREGLKKQQEAEREFNAEDREQAEEEERRRRREQENAMIEIDSASDASSDVEIVEAPPVQTTVVLADDSGQGPSVSEAAQENGLIEATNATPEPEFEDVQIDSGLALSEPLPEATGSAKDSPEPVFENVTTTGVPNSSTVPVVGALEGAPESQSAEVLPNEPRPEAATSAQDDDLFAGLEYDDFSDPEDEELLAQMDEEAEEHARFASELNQKSAQQNREDYEKELRALRNQQKKDRRDADEVTQVMVTECQALLRLFGIPYITAPMEAEAQCAALVRMGLVDGIVTDDSDTFLFGGTRVYKNMFNTNKFVECYIDSDIEKEMSLSRNELISLAQLLGSDYTEGLPGVGPVTAVEILSEFPGKAGLDEFREWWKEVQSHGRPLEMDKASPFRRKFRKSQATKLFLPPGFPSPAVYEAYMHPEVDDSTEPFQWGVPDVEGLRRFLMATIGWSKERTDEVLVPVIKDMNRREVEGTQSNITRFFGGSVGAGAREAFAPRHRAQVSKRMVAAVDRLRSRAGESNGQAQEAEAEAATEADGDGDGDEGVAAGPRKRRRTGRQQRS
ncbi:hypothetical protein B0I35DRAFT_351378 [Stachybotrys elegans]|uniref:Uncharacterized protein n=1 Tax=Stachybotrys elegans TaxID=80388 RepID=A0A8K0SUN3_9HYPO|nr:hypothetical protein B0I35DRAFT_351378 [Stachybotrys elegans]